MPILPITIWKSNDINGGKYDYVNWNSHSLLHVTDWDLVSFTSGLYCHGDWAYHVIYNSFIYIHTHITSICILHASLISSKNLEIIYTKIPTNHSFIFRYNCLLTSSVIHASSISAESWPLILIEYLQIAFKIKILYNYIFGIIMSHLLQYGMQHHYTQDLAPLPYRACTFTHTYLISE